MIEIQYYVILSKYLIEKELKIYLYGKNDSNTNVYDQKILFSKYNVSQNRVKISPF